MADLVSYGNADRDIEQALNALKKGAQLLKYGRKGKPKFYPFRLSNDESSLIWFSSSGERKLKLACVSKIIPGQRTAVFQRYLCPEKDYLSFSLIYNNGRRSLDLICKDKLEAELWFAGLRALISSGQCGRSKIDGWSDGGLCLDDSRDLTSSSPSESSVGAPPDIGSPKISISKSANPLPKSFPLENSQHSERSEIFIAYTVRYQERSGSIFIRVMRTGRMQTSAQERDASIFDSTIEPEANSVASTYHVTSTRRGRGRSKNISLTRLIKDTGQKLKIEIPEGLSRPVGKYAKQFKTEVGIICRTYAPLACSTWPTVKQEHRQIFYDRILDKFDIDLHDPRLKKAVNSYLASTFKNYWNRLHSHYKRVGNHEVACQKPYEGVSQEDWELCCNRFCLEEFQKVSKKNSENRQLLKVNHCAGSKSFVEYLHETHDAPIGRIELWHKTHYSQEKGWSTLECQLLYDKMITLQSQPTEEDSPPLTDDEICKQVLGTRPGYVRGLGHGVVAPPSSSTGLQNNLRVEELTKKAATAERQAQELTEQLQRMEAQMEAQRQQMEAQMEVQMAGQKQQMEVQMEGQKQQMEAQINEMRSWQKNMETMMQSIMAQKMGTPP